MAIAGHARSLLRPDRPRWIRPALLAGVLVATLAGTPAVSAADPTPTPIAAPTPTPSAAPTPTASPSPTPSPSPAPTATPAPTPTPTSSPVPTPVPTPTPAPTATPTPYPTPSWPTTITTLGSSVRFYGRGWGHGVGMSQYGARGRANAGQAAEQILGAYYKGSTLGTISPNRAVRVLVLTAYPAPSVAPLVVTGRGGSWGISTDPARVFPAAGTLKAWRETTKADGTTLTTWRVRIYDKAGTQLYGTIATASPVVRPLAAGTTLEVTSRTSSYDLYRGTLTLRLSPSAVSVINTVGMDDYLRGVVPVEMPPSWPTQALRAQAIAARTYAAFHLRPNEPWDVYDDTRSQVYRGREAEQATTNAVIAADAGVVLRYGTGLVNAVFHSTGGGATESSEFAFVGSSGDPGTKVGYLRGIQDRPLAGSPYDAASPWFGWSTSVLTRSQLSGMFAKDSRTAVGGLERLDLRRRGVSGRLYQVVLYGSTGTKTVSADVFRSVYNTYKPSSAAILRSNLFDTSPIR